MTEQTPENPTEPTEDDDLFPRAYVEKLRAEAASHRTTGQEARREALLLREALQSAALREGCAGVLHEPVEWSEDFIGEDGLPDVDRVREAAEALAEDKPHLARVRGDAGQRFRGTESGTVDLADLLRAGS